MNNDEWVPPKGRGSVLKKDVEECLIEWGKTLEHFDIQRRPAIHDEVTIAQGILHYGSEWVKLAIIGARKEERNKEYDPARFVSLRSLLSEERIERLVNLGGGAKSPDEGPRIGKLEPLKWLETSAGWLKGQT